MARVVRARRNRAREREIERGGVCSRERVERG